MKVQAGKNCYSALERNGSEWSNSRSGLLLPGKETWYPLNRRLGEPQSRHGGFEKDKNLRVSSPGWGLRKQIFRLWIFVVHFHFVYFEITNMTLI
jgi:hypothetical protein